MSAPSGNPSEVKNASNVVVPAKTAPVAVVQKDSTVVGFLKDFVIGGASGAVAKTITAPIERVKIIIQTQDANPRIISGEVPRYTGIVNCFSRVRSEQGFGAFWRGNMTNVIRYFPTQAFNFAFKDSIKKMFPKYSPKTEFGKFFLVQLASGGLAGAGSLCIVYPLDYARTRLASDVGAKRDFNGLWDCLSKTARGPSGILGLYNGFGVSVMGIIPYRGVYFGLYDTLRELNPYKSDLSPIGFAARFAVAQTTAIAAGYASYPFDTVRRRLQMQSEKPKEQWVYKGAAHCLNKVIKDEGVNALFKGAGANALRTVGSALVLVLYDSLQTFLGVNIGAGGAE
ncbi:mitochondrial ADP/ATP transporter [Acrasis kona]|uniref:ADP/ATP translocase n=1 Tax=Acrasis kona TaxID=1008807 RepID=A0AAW2ZGC5_9EUKA